VAERAAKRSVLVAHDPQDFHCKAVLDALRTRNWEPVPTPTPAAVEDAVATRPECAVGLLAMRAGSSIAEAQAVCAAGPVLWVALLDRELLDQPAIARFVADSAYDFHTYPADPARIEVVLGRAWGMAHLRARLKHQEPEQSDYEMVGSSPAMLELFAQTRKVAAVDAPVLITGESGTGKELTALAVHERSSRRAGPFVAVNCGALPPTLIQAELFGHEKGAFTGAAARRIGRIESAAGGTLFLDEIGDLPLELQGHLLRFVQQGTIERLGSVRPLPVNARVIAATNVDLEQAVLTGNFRQDLYYRLNVLRLNMPPLRERGEDVVLLAKFFFRMFAAEKRPHVQGYSQKTLQALMQHDWPGNVRELINRVRRALVMSENRLLTPEDLGLNARAFADGALEHGLDAVRERAEREALAAHLQVARGNVSVTARRLGVSRVTLYRLLEKHGLRRPGRIS
jgi:DNA-binding NtrC family response regulator